MSVEIRAAAINGLRISTVRADNLALRSTPPEPTAPSPTQMEAAIVLRVIDGDTVELSLRQKVRLMGVDTPETQDPWKPVQFRGPSP
jgi:endonuclease YncB( thermonuclease family)